MTFPLNLFHHRFEPGADPSATPVLLLHGTGGDEHDLMDFGRSAAPRAPLLSARGRVLEGPMPRWFRRFGEGQFDLADMEARAQELAGFIAAARAHYGLSQAPIALGYSNGANIAAALLMRSPEALSGAVLMRGMNGLAPKDGLDLHGKRVLFLSGQHDPLAPEASRAVLKAALSGAGAEVAESFPAPGHALTMQDAAEAKAWLQSAS